MVVLRQRVANAAWLIVVSVVALVAGGLAMSPVSAAPGDGILTVEVNRDFSGDGIYDAMYDPPQQGVAVRVTDGITVAGPVVTNAAGQAIFDLELFAGSSFRIDVEITDPALDHLQAAPAAPGSTPNAFRSFTTFVGSGTQTVHIGVWNPADYAPRNPPLAVVQQMSREVSPAMRSIATTFWDNRGPLTDSTADNTTGFTTVATQGETGTVFGTAWDHRTGFIYSASYAKAHTNYGPGGNGAIYRTDAEAGAPGNTEVWTTVPNAGTSVHQTEFGYDDAFFLANGRESLGGLALSEDGQTLYTVNLADRSLYTFSTASPAPAPVTSVTGIADPGCLPSGEWRPFAVTVRDGEVYVGGICDASVSINRGDLAVHILRLDGAAFTSVFSASLDFRRGAQNYSDPVPNLTGPNVATNWNPWRTTWGPDLADYAARAPIYPMPLLTDLEFENDGSMILGFRDRWSDAVVPSGWSPDPDNRHILSNMIVGGDINKACLTNGVYEWEGTGSCPDNNTPATSGGEPADRVEFFPGDFFYSGIRYPGSNIRHYENSMGGLAFAPREPDVANTTMDPTGLYNTGGIGFYDRQDGTGPGTEPLDRGLIVAGNSSVNFGKANGLGDIEILMGQAPIQIGNYMWFDADTNGTQDPDEPPLVGATVRLLSSDGTVLATTTTDANGEYYFGGEGGYPLEPGVDYIIEFDVSTIDPSGLPGSPPLEHLLYTTTQAASAGTIHDSNPTPTSNPLVARANVTAPSQPGGVDHTIDAGIIVASVDIEKGDSGGPGEEDPGTIVNDADTSEDGQGYAPGSTREIVFDVTNTSSTIPLYNVRVTDQSFSGAAVTAMSCLFPGEGSPTAGVYDPVDGWTVDWLASYGDAGSATPWMPDVMFSCTAALTISGDETPHMDRVTVLTDISPAASPDDAPHTGPSDRDDYVAFSGAIQVIKYDGNGDDPDVGSSPTWVRPDKPLADAGQDANTPGDAVWYPADEPQPVRWVVTNMGETWLADVMVVDTTDDGPDVGAWVCDLTPVGGPAGYSFTTTGPWAGPLAPGASFFCEGPLELSVDSTHADAVDVEGTVVPPVLDDDGNPVIGPDGLPEYHRNTDGTPVRSTIVVTDDDPFHAATLPTVEIEKGDSGGPGEEDPGTIVNDADTSEDGQGYAPGSTREIVFDVTHTSSTAPLYNVRVTDQSFSGAEITAMSCLFPGEGSPTAGVYDSVDGWTVDWLASYGDAGSATPWLPGVTFTCTAALSIAGDDAPHMDRATVLTDLAPAASPDVAPHTGPTDRDDYVAFSGAIQVIKYDGNGDDPDVGSSPTWTRPDKPLADSDQDANTPGDAVLYPADEAQPVRWVVTNMGETWLADVMVVDTTDDGPDVGAWVCDLVPVGGPAGYSFTTTGPWAGPLAPGASFFCEGPLELPAGATHADTVDVEGTVVPPVLDDDGNPVIGPDGLPEYHRNTDGSPVRSTIVVTDDDPFHAETTPTVEIEKGDSGGPGEENPGTVVNDADTSEDGQGYAPGSTREIVFDVTNTSSTIPLFNVRVTDQSFSGAEITAMSCLFPGAGLPTDGVHDPVMGWVVDWLATYGPPALATPWLPGVTFSCTAALTVAGVDAPHMDRVTVLTDVAPAASPDDAPHTGPTDHDDYVAFSGAIQVIKYDGNGDDPDVGSSPAWTRPTKPLTDAGQDANTPDDAALYPADEPQPVRWVVTNTGHTWLADVIVVDTTGDGPDVGAWTCDLTPVGGPAGYSFTTIGPWEGPLAPDASFFCEGPLTLPADSAHANSVDVEGTVVPPVLDDDGNPVIGPDGLPEYHRNTDGSPVRSTIVVIDDDLFHAEAPPELPTTTTTLPTETTTTVPSDSTTSTTTALAVPKLPTYPSTPLPRTGFSTFALLILSLAASLGGTSLVLGTQRSGRRGAGSRRR